MKATSLLPLNRLTVARGLYPLYKPHFVIVHLRYPKDVAILEECLAMAGRVPVVAAISLLAKETLVKAVKEKAASFVVLPVKPQTIRETLRSLELSEDEGQFPSARKKSLGTDYPGEKEPTQEILFRRR